MNALSNLSRPPPPSQFFLFHASSPCCTDIGTQFFPMALLQQLSSSARWTAACVSSRRPPTPCVPPSSRPLLRAAPCCRYSFILSEPPPVAYSHALLPSPPIFPKSEKWVIKCPAAPLLFSTARVSLQRREMTDHTNCSASKIRSARVAGDAMHANSMRARYVEALFRLETPQRPGLSH